MEQNNELGGVIFHQIQGLKWIIFYIYYCCIRQQYKQGSLFTPLFIFIYLGESGVPSQTPWMTKLQQAPFLVYCVHRFGNSHSELTSSLGCILIVKIKRLLKMLTGAFKENSILVILK